MWLSLGQNAVRRLHLVDRQSIWPVQGPASTEAELVITTEATLTENVLISTPRMARVAYRVDSCAASMTLGDAPPAPWPEAASVSGAGFELMLSDRGPLSVPAQGAKLPNRLASWLQTLEEAIRTSWVVPKRDVQVNSRWPGGETAPVGLPSGVDSVEIEVVHAVDSLRNDVAQITTRFDITVLSPAGAGPQTKQGEGSGTVRISLHRVHGPTQALRAGQIEIMRAGAARQVLKGNMELRQLVADI